MTMSHQTYVCVYRFSTMMMIGGRAFGGALSICISVNNREISNDAAYRNISCHLALSLTSSWPDPTILHQKGHPNAPSFHWIIKPPKIFIPSFLPSPTTTQNTPSKETLKSSNYKVHSLNELISQKCAQQRESAGVIIKGGKRIGGDRWSAQPGFSGSFSPCSFLEGRGTLKMVIIASLRRRDSGRNWSCVNIGEFNPLCRIGWCQQRKWYFVYSMNLHCPGLMLM